MTQIPGIGSPDSSTTNALDPTTAIGSPTTTDGPRNAHGTIKRWFKSPPPPKPQWSPTRTRAIEQARRAEKNKTDPSTCVSATWLLERLDSGEKCLYPLLERAVERVAMPPGAKWKLRVKHVHAVRVIATAQFDCGDDRPNGLIASQEELAMLLMCSRSTARRIVQQLEEWELLKISNRDRAAGDGVGRWAARNLYTLSETAVLYWSIGRLTRRAGPAKALPRKPPRAQAIPSNPDGMPPANPEVQIEPPNSPKISNSLPDTNSPRRFTPPDRTQINFGPAKPAAPSAPGATRDKSEKRATPPTTAARAPSRPPPSPLRTADAKLQPPIRVPRPSDEEGSADAMEALIRRYGEPSPDELAAIALLRRGGRA